jgi:hypothetical protein
MGVDPLYLAWDVYCTSPQDASRIRESLARAADVNRVLTIEIESGGKSSKAFHRIGDYFENIQVFLQTNGNPNTVRVVFHRRSEAGRFWKDIMARIVRSVDETGTRRAVRLAYRGNDCLDWGIPKPA